MPSRTFTRRLVDQMFWAIKKIWLTLLKRTTLHWSLLLHAKMIGKFSLGLFKIKYIHMIFKIGIQLLNCMSGSTIIWPSDTR